MPPASQRAQVLGDEELSDGNAAATPISCLCSRRWICIPVCMTAVELSWLVELRIETDLTQPELMQSLICSLPPVDDLQPHCLGTKLPAMKVMGSVLPPSNERHAQCIILFSESRRTLEVCTWHQFPTSGCHPSRCEPLRSAEMRTLETCKIVQQSQ